MNSRKDNIKNQSSTRMKREKQSKEKHGLTKKGKKDTLRPQSCSKSQNQSILPEIEKKGHALTIIKDKDNCSIKKNKLYEEPRFLSEAPIPINDLSSPSDISDSDFVVISDASPISSKEPSPYEYEVLLNKSCIESKLLHQQKHASAKNVSNSPQKYLKDSDETNISPSTSAKQATISCKSNISAISSDSTLDIKENENITSYTSTFSQVNVLPEIEINLETNFSELMQPEEFLHSYGNSNLNINTDDFDQNQLQNGNESNVNNEGNFGCVSPENCLLLLNNTLDAEVESKESFIYNKLNIEPVIKPSDFNYESNNNAFILAIDLSILKAASNYVKEKTPGLADTLFQSPFDLENMEWQNSAAKPKYINSNISDSCNDLGKDGVVQFNSEDAQSEISLVSCSTNGIQLDFFDMRVEENAGKLENLSNGPPSTFGNFDTVLNEQIYLDMNIGANVVCANESFEKFPDSNDFNFDCNSKMPRRGKKRKKTWYPKKQRCRRKNVSYDKNCTVPNASLSVEVYCDTCDEESQEHIDFTTALSDREKTGNAGITTESYNQFDDKINSLITLPIVATSVTDRQDKNTNTKRMRIVDCHSALSDVEKSKNTRHITEPYKELKDKEFKDKTTGPISDPIDASFNADNCRSNTKRKRKRCIWDTKKRRCKKKNRPPQTKNTESIEPVIGELFCDTCDETEAEELDGDNSENLRISELKEKENCFTSSNSCSELDICPAPATRNNKNLEQKSNKEVFCDEMEDGTRDNCEIFSVSVSEEKEILKSGFSPCNKPNSFSISQISVTKSTKDAESNAVELTEDDKYEILRPEELKHKEFFKSGPISNQQCSIDNCNTAETSCSDINKPFNDNDNVLKEIVCNIHGDDEMEELSGESCRVSKVSNIEGEVKEVMKTSSDSCSQLNSGDSSQIKGTKINERTLTPEILGNADDTEELFDVNEISVPVELDNGILETEPDSYQMNSTDNCHIPASSSLSNTDKVSSHYVNDVSFQESINLMDDDLDFEPDPFDHTNVEIPSKCCLDNTYTNVTIKPSVSNETVIEALNEISVKNNEVELCLEPHSKTNHDFPCLSPKNSSFSSFKASDSLSCLNFVKTYEPLSQEKNLPSEDDSDSDSEYNFKRTRRGNNCPYEDEFNYSNSNSCNENGFRVHENTSNSQNEVTNCEMLQNGSLDGHKIFYNSSEKHQDILSHNGPDTSQFCDLEGNKTSVQSSRSQISGAFNRLEDVVSKIKYLCSEKLVTEALKITQTYIAISYNNEVNSYLIQELFFSLLSLIHKNAENINISVPTIFDEVLKIIEDYNIHDKLVASKYIIECCSNPDLYLHSIKMFYSCKKRNIILKTAAIKIFGSFLKAEDISLNVLLTFLDYIKFVCNKKMPKDLTHMALGKCKVYNFADAHHMCLLLHNITFKEVDPANLQEFLLLCFKHEMWANIADMFVAWDSRHYLLECVYNALASACENIGDYFDKLTDSLFHGHEGAVSSYQTYFIGQIGTALMLCTFKKCNYQCALEVLYTLHAYNINYFQQVLSTCKLYLAKCSKESDSNVMAFPFLVVFIAVDICLHFKRGKDAFQIFQGFSWIVSDVSLDASLKLDVINHRFQRLLKLVPFLINESSLTDGWEALKMLLLSAEQDLSTEDLKKYATDLQNVYNSYFIALINSEKTSPMKDLYEHSLGSCKEIITVVPDVLRGLIVTFAKIERIKEAKSLFMLGIIQKIYNIVKPELESFPWQLTIKTDWNVLEIKFAVEWFLEALLQVLEDKPVQIDYAQWFSVKILFEISNAVSSEINCLNEIATDPISAIKRAGEALESLSPSLKFNADTIETSICISPDSVRNYWFHNSSIVSPKIAVFSNLQSGKKKVSFGKESDIDEGKSPISLLDQQDSGIKLKESLNLRNHSPSFSENLHLQSYLAEDDNDSDSVENILDGLIDEIRDNVSKPSVIPIYASGSYLNTPSISSCSNNFETPLSRQSGSQVYPSDQQSTVMESELEMLPLNEVSNVIKNSINNLNSDKFGSQNQKHQLTQGSFQSLSSVPGNEDNVKNTNFMQVAPSLVVNQSTNSKINDGLEISPFTSDNHFNNVSDSVKINTQHKQVPIKRAYDNQSFSEKLKIGRPSIEELSNFHVVKISNTKHVSPNLSNNQERIWIEPATPSSSPKISRRKKAKSHTLITSPASEKLHSITKKLSVKLKKNAITGSTTIKSTKRKRNVNEKQKFENFTISLTPNTSGRTISQCAFQPSNQSMPSTSEIFRNEESDVSQMECLTNENAWYSSSANVSFTDASASLQKFKIGKINFRNTNSNTESKHVSLLYDQNVHSTSPITNEEHNVRVQVKCDTNSNACRISTPKKVITLMDDINHQQSKPVKISLVRNTEPNSGPKCISLPSAQNIHLTSQAVTNERTSLMSHAKCFSSANADHTSSLEKSVLSIDDVSIQQSKTVKISSIRNAASDISKHASLPSNQSMHLISQIAADQQFSTISQATSVSSTSTSNASSGENVFSLNLEACPQLSKTDRISLIRNATSDVSKCTLPSNQNMYLTSEISAYEKSSIISQAKSVSSANASHTSSGKNVSTVYPQARPQFSKADKISLVKSTPMKTHTVNKCVSQPSNKNINTKHSNLPQTESVPNFDASHASTGRISLVRNVAPMKIETVNKCVVSQPSNQIMNKKHSNVPQIESVLNSNAGHASTDRISLIRNGAPIKIHTINKSVSQPSNHNMKKFSIITKAESVPNSSASYVSTSVKSISSDAAANLLQQSKPCISSVRISTTFLGNSSCKTEEYKKIYQFLKIKVTQKHKNLSPTEQHEKAVTLAETFMKDNSVATMDKKIMKLLTEFAMSNV